LLPFSDLAHIQFGPSNANTQVDEEGLPAASLTKNGEMLPMKSFLITACLLILTLALVAPKSLLAADAGADTFKTKCAMCHGPNGDASNAMAKKFGLKPLSAPEVQKMSDADLSAVIEKGKDKMKPVAGLKPDQVKDVVKYLRTLK